MRVIREDGSFFVPPYKGEIIFPRFARRGVQRLTAALLCSPPSDETVVAICWNLWYGNNRAMHERQAVGYILREEVVDMPITITLHILGYVVTIRIKSENRHSAK